MKINPISEDLIKQDQENINAINLGITNQNQEQAPATKPITNNSDITTQSNNNSSINIPTQDNSQSTINPINNKIYPDPAIERPTISEPPKNIENLTTPNNSQTVNNVKNTKKKYIFIAIIILIVITCGYFYWINKNKVISKNNDNITKNINYIIDSKLDSKTTTNIGGQTWTINYPSKWTVRENPYFGVKTNAFDKNSPARYSELLISANFYDISKAGYTDANRCNQSKRFSIINIKKYQLPNIPGYSIYQLVSKWTYNSENMYGYYIIVNKDDLNATVGSNASEVMCNAGFKSKNGTKLGMYILLNPIGFKEKSDEYVISLFDAEEYKTAVEILKSVRSE